MYPYDFLWRKKYSIPFGSKQHTDMSHIDMVLDLHEELVLYGDKKDDDVLDSYTQIQPNTDAKTVVKMSKKDIDEEFDNIDLTKY